jgi:hypothetical protein
MLSKIRSARDLLVADEQEEELLKRFRARDRPETVV